MTDATTLNAETQLAAYELDHTVLRQIITIDLSDLHSAPWNENVTHDHAPLERLGLQMMTYGQLQPILVRASSSGDGGASFEVISGERRYQAAKLVGMQSLNTFLFEECDDRTARHIHAMDQLSHAESDPYTETITILDYMADLLAHAPKWSELVQAKGGRREAAAWVIRRNRDDFPQPTPSVGLALDITPLDLKTALLTIFGPGSSLNLRTFNRHRLPLLALHETLVPLVQSHQLDSAVALLLTTHEDEDRMTHLAKEAAAQNWSAAELRKQLKGDPKYPRRPRQEPILKAVNALESVISGDRGELTPEAKRQAAEQLKRLASMLE